MHSGNVRFWHKADLTRRRNPSGELRQFGTNSKIRDNTSQHRPRCETRKIARNSLGMLSINGRCFVLTVLVSPFKSKSRLEAENAALRHQVVVLRRMVQRCLALFKSRCRLEAENLFLRHQLTIALRRARPRLRLRGNDRALMVWLVWLWPSLLGAAQIVRPDTILRWHRAGFRAYWRWKSRGRAGRPRIDRNLREPIQRMSQENPLWGASRIHGELLMLGFEVAQSTVSKYMQRGGKPPSQLEGPPRW